MRKIKYKKLIIQDFLSIGKDSITIDFQHGLNLITGINIDNPERKNAVGKSSIIEAFYYAVFGTTIRNINKEFISNNVTKGKGNIELYFDVQTDTGTNSYKIVRQVKPTKCELYKLGDTEEDISKDSIANTNKYICDLIGSNSVMCKSCDILSLSDNVPFMAKKPEDKRKFIEDIFALEIFGKMLKDLKEYIKENKAELSISSTKCQEITNSINTLKTQFHSQKKQIEEKEENLKKRKLEIEENISRVKDEMKALVFVENFDLEKELEKYQKALENVDCKISDCNISISHDTMNIKGRESQIKELNSIDFGSKCSKCRQDIPHNSDHVKDELEACEQLLKSHNESLELSKIELDKNKKLKEKIKNKISELENSIFQNKFNRQKNDTLYDSLKHYEKSLETLNEDLNETNVGLQNFEDLITETEERFNTESENLKELTLKQDDYESCKFILGEEGIKSFIIKRLLGMLNTSIQKYINTLGMSMKCKFDEYFDEQMTDDRGSKLCYWSFSGGERKTIDIACSWAFKDIKRKISGISSNVEFLDEILDSAFDERGLDLLIEVIKERIDKDKLSSYAISHRKETMKHIDGETVNLEKENKITRRVL
jgi:DNA repair exonuclease SbcCD ATPase subunit